jgi:hypothetical protein
MISHWEEFEAGPTEPVDRRMHVTLSPRNVIHLNGNIHDRLGNPDAVVLLFDKLNSIIGINPAPASRPNAFPVKMKGRGRHRQIRATPFCKHYGIKVDRTTLFLNAEIDDEGVLRLDLKATTELNRSKSKGRTR